MLFYKDGKFEELRRSSKLQYCTDSIKAERRAANRFKIWRDLDIIGGMHGFKDYKLLEGFGLIAPSHCTVNKKKIAELFPKAYIETKAGLEISLK